MAADQVELYERFAALHAQPDAFLMPNAWDGGSAAVLAHAGFQALESSSFAIAYSRGRPDGTHAVSRLEAIANAQLLADVSGLPINGDLEDGFGPNPDDCVATVESAIKAGLAGVGLEDTTANPALPIHVFDDAVARIKAAAKAATGRIVLTARCDNFLQQRHDLDDTIRRLTAFAEVGADVLFAPSLPDMNAIRAVVTAVSPQPVNVFGPTSGLVSLATLSQAGVKRVSLGSHLYREAMATVAEQARMVREEGLEAIVPRMSIPSLKAVIASTPAGKWDR